MLCNVAQAEKKMEQMRRGNKDTQTSDAKFDEQFKLGHQMSSQVNTVSKHFKIQFQSTQSMSKSCRCHLSFR